MQLWKLSFVLRKKSPQPYDFFICSKERPSADQCIQALQNLSQEELKVIQSYKDKFSEEIIDGLINEKKTSMLRYEAIVRNNRSMWLSTSQEKISTWMNGPEKTTPDDSISLEKISFATVSEA